MTDIDIPCISIIVPVYNSEHFLHECISSVLSQSYTNFELILINDGSTDASASICQEYASKDNRIVYFYKKNGGVSSARNLGLANARGKWITFIDSDDTVSKNYLSDLVASIIGEKVLVIQNMDGAGIQLENKILSGKDMIRYYFSHNVSFLTGPVAKIYNKKIIDQNRITFPVDIHMGEDAIFILRYFKYIETLVIVDHTNYYIRKHDGSLTTCYNAFESEYNCFKLWRKELLEILSQDSLYSDPLAEAWKSKLSYTFKRIFKAIVYNKKYSLTTKLSCFKKIEETDLIEFKQFYSAENNKDRLFYFLIKNRLYLSYLFIEWINKKISR